jgi:hypothetical protein
VLTPAERDSAEREHFAWRQRERDLTDLKYHWGEAYDIRWESGETGGWVARRRDTGEPVRAATAADLDTAMFKDYNAEPVPRTGGILP